MSQQFSQSEYYLGRMATWLHSLASSALLKEFPDSVKSIKDVVAQAKDCSSEDFDFVFGSAYSWLETLSVSGGLEDEPKRRIDTLLSEVSKFRNSKVKE